MGDGIHRIGVLGAGRLGRVLARRLAGRFHVAVHDRDARLARQFAEPSGIDFLGADDLVRTSDLVALCIPGDQVVPWLLGLLPSSRAGGWFVNLATDLPTTALRREPRLAGVRVVGLKPVAQFVSLSRGLPGLFVTTASDPSELALLEHVFSDLGRVVPGDEDIVGEVNRRATEAALRFCLGWPLERSMPIDPDVAEAALKNVVVGTILDFPPDPANGYTARIIEAIRMAREPVGGPPC